MENRREDRGDRKTRKKTETDTGKKKKKGYWKMKEEALDRNHWRTRFGKGYGPVVRQTTQTLYRPGELLRVPGD